MLVSAKYTRLLDDCLTNKLTGARARRAAGTHSPHEDAEGMGAVGVRVERPVRLVQDEQTVDASGLGLCGTVGLFKGGTKPSKVKNLPKHCSQQSPEP